ncbi:lipase [Arthrobacter sp. MSA 4-2]|uniref:GDSL-type esterase/lipase family protein n=1 Tax=Arthrobacter sp. MSA 4-2 TaxID=2794349 RepID=UPI0018E876A7|nr:SGNH/GDSL hydrolase family protein [Arthrobacter sp. MSA 4-2]MBJ2122380.1 lipase [Arthrobacter sp. MSA 4-2]
MISIPLTPAHLRGAQEVESTPRGLRPHRLPAWVRTRFPDPQLMMMEAQPSGIRVVGKTSAGHLELVTHPTRLAYRGVDRPRGHVDLTSNGILIGSDVLSGGDVTEVDPQTGASTFRSGVAHVSVFSDLPEGDKLIELWLPHNESVELVELRADAPVAVVAPAGPVWLHHGSSISQGSNSSTPTGTWPAVAARAGGAQLHNLGFGGSALADPFVARVIRDTPADFISVKLGINLVNLDVMRMRAFESAVHGFLDTIRDGHPETPLLLVSPIFCGIHEDTPGPGAIDPASFGTSQIRFMATGEEADSAQGRLTLRTIRACLASIVERRSEDENLHFLDGLHLYGQDDAIEQPLPDALHPDMATHEMIGERFAAYAFSPLGPFARRDGS